MNGQEFCGALKQGQRVYGTLIVSPSPEWPRQVKNIGLDFVFIDTEHIALDRQILSWMCRTYSALGMAPIVRIPSPDPYRASMVLDGGASGVIAPYVETAEQVRLLSGAVKLSPVKGQKMLQMLAEQPGASEPELDDYLEKRNSGNALLVNIESTAAIEALDDILAVEGLDGILVGPHDLSCSLDIPEQYNHPKFDQAVKNIIRKANAKGVSVGVHFFWKDIEYELSWIKEGANIIIHRDDISAFTETMRSDLDRIRRALNEKLAPLNEESFNI